MRKSAMGIAVILAAALPLPLQASDLGETRSAARDQVLFSAYQAAATAGMTKPATGFSGLPAGALRGKAAFGKFQLPTTSTSFAVLPQPTEAPSTPGFEDVALASLDVNGDGQPDGWGGDRDGNGAYDLILIDSDGDGQADVVLLDNDYNGVVDTKLIPGAQIDGKAVDLYGLDIDEDGLYDFVGYDWDQDGVMDELLPA